MNQAGRQAGRGRDRAKTQRSESVFSLFPRMHINLYLKNWPQAVFITLCHTVQAAGEECGHEDCVNCKLMWQFY